MFTAIGSMSLLPMRRIQPARFGRGGGERNIESNASACSKGAAVPKLSKLTQVHVVLCPAMSVTAYRHAHSEPQHLRQLDGDGQPAPYSSTGLIWASAATSTGLPAAVVPIDRGDSPLPIGVQVIGPYLGDRTVLAFATQLEREFGGFVPPLGYA